MKYTLLFLLLNLGGYLLSFGQDNQPSELQRQAITSLIEQYSKARETSDSALLEEILTPDIDQLTSGGEWRTGIGSAIQGMQRSTATNAGTRTLNVEKIRMLNDAAAIVDCRYEIKNTTGGIRKMWSSFLVVDQKNKWKISAIRNMLPAPTRN